MVTYDPAPMSVLEALLLGIVQGLTEFLPISSSGHLIIVPWLQDYTFLENNDSFNKTFDVALHAGTLVAAISYFRHEVARFTVAFIHPRESDRSTRSTSGSPARSPSAPCPPSSRVASARASSRITSASPG